MELFEVAAFEKQVEIHGEIAKKARLVLVPTALLAKNRDAAIALAGKLIPEDVDTDRLEVLVRPFRG